VKNIIILDLVVIVHIARIIRFKIYTPGHIEVGILCDIKEDSPANILKIYYTIIYYITIRFLIKKL